MCISVRYQSAVDKRSEECFGDYTYLFIVPLPAQDLKDDESKRLQAIRFLYQGSEKKIPNVSRKLETQQIFIQNRESTRNDTISFHWNETISCIERQQRNEFTNVHHLGDFMKTNFGGNYHRNVDALSAFKYIFHGMAWHGNLIINTHLGCWLMVYYPDYNHVIICMCSIFVFHV